MNHTRVGKLVSAIKSGRRITTLNDSENTIMNHEDRIRSFNDKFDGKLFEVVDDVSVSWMQGAEMLRFVAEVNEADYADAMDLIVAARNSNLDFKNKILDRLLAEAKAKQLPVEWVIAGELEDKKNYKPQKHDFYISKEGL